MSAPLRVALIGSGIGWMHARAYRWMPERFDIPVLCALDPPRSHKLMAKWNVGQFSLDFAETIARDDIDVVDICTPPNLHFEMTKAALEAGKHVICEKPLFGSVAECDAMAEVVAKTGKTLMPIFQYRFGAGLQKLKRLVELGLTGDPFLTTIETHWWRDAAYYAVDWRGKWATEYGGGLLGHAIHAHDMLNYIHGPSAEVFAMTSTLVNPIEVEDTAALSIRLANGSLASLSMTLGSRREISRLRFAFRDLVAESQVEPYTMYRDPWTFRAQDEAHQAKVDAVLAAYPAHEDSWTRQFELFHEAVTAGGELPVTLEDARRSMELVTAAYHSSRTNAPVRLPLDATHPLYASWLPEGVVAV